MRELYADVIVDLTSEKLDRVFQYRVPAGLGGALEPGMVVEIPFGRGGRVIKGYVTAVDTPLQIEAGRVKDIIRIVTEGLGEEEKLVALAGWMKQRYGCTMAQALRTVIPIRKNVRHVQQQTVALKLSEEQCGQQLALYRKKHQTARARLLEALMDQPELPWQLVREKLHMTKSTVDALCEQGVVELRTERVYRNPVSGLERGGGRVTLTDEQQAAVSRVTDEWDQTDADGRYGRYLLHGVTGSGKTEVYLQLIEEAISRGQQAIVLIPEIALTYQTVLRFYRRFGNRVSFIHSRLSAGERYDQFEQARKGLLDVMIGPRSALFTPFPDLGLIVIDEEHEPAYGSETTPRYHAREVAEERAALEGARLVLGSATPSMEAYAGAMAGRLTLLRLTKRTGTAHLPSVEVVDMREQLRRGCRTLLSAPMCEAVRETLAAGEQCMLFLNRRGYAGFVSCRMCGYVARCPHCDVSLSLHHNGKLICHYCGHEEAWTGVCPSCGSDALRSFRAGTQQIEEEVRSLFPQARVLRMDADTTKEKEGHARILSAFADHEADIMIGTQMIVKGHDFSGVTLVGILAADLSLNAPDYRSAERTFQLLTQAAGRAGRAERPGRVLIQTYDPDHYSIRCASGQDYEAFYQEESVYRQMAGYPPAGALTAVHMSGPDPEKLAVAADWLRKIAVRAAGKVPVQVLGPADEPVAKIQDIYRKVIYLKYTDRKTLELLRDRLQRYIDINDGFRGIQIQYEAE